MKQQQQPQPTQIQHKKKENSIPFQQKKPIKQNNNQTQQPLLIQRNSDDLYESSIAQEEVAIFSQTKINSKQRKNNTQNKQLVSKPRLRSFDKPQNINKDSAFLLAQSLNNKSKIVTIHQVKDYEEKAKNQSLQFKLSLRNETPSIKAQHTKQEKHLKKSLSSSKFSRQKLSIADPKQVIKKVQQQESVCNSKYNRRQDDFQALNRSSSSKFVTNVRPSISPMVVPFSLQNINSAINNLQLQNELELNSGNSVRSESKIQKLNQNDIESRKKSLKGRKQCELLRKLSSSKYLVDVPLDLNQFQYQIKMKVSLQKNRGFQLYLISRQNRQLRSSYQSNFSNIDNDGFEEVQHFKYEVIQLPNNLIRMRVYLLISSANDQSNKNVQNIVDPPNHQNISPITINNSIKEQYRYSYSTVASGRLWKVWKQMQIPLISHEKEEQNRQNNFGFNNKKISITLTNVNLNCVRVEINNMLDFHINLHHPRTPVSSYCLHQDSNGVQFNKLSISGSESIKVHEDLGEGCQSKCQLI